MEVKRIGERGVVECVQDRLVVDFPGKQSLHGAFHIGPSRKLSVVLLEDDIECVYLLIRRVIEVYA